VHGGVLELQLIRVEQAEGPPVSGQQLPELLDCRALRTELGVSRATAEAIMRRLPVVTIERLRKTFVRRSDVAAYIDAHTYLKDQMPA
jgi:hypothetical protein